VHATIAMLCGHVADGFSPGSMSSAEPVLLQAQRQPSKDIHDAFAFVLTGADMLVLAKVERYEQCPPEVSEGRLQQRIQPAFHRCRAMQVPNIDLMIVSAPPRENCIVICT
jgi:hypothetical protein